MTVDRQHNGMEALRVVITYRKEGNIDQTFDDPRRRYRKTIVVGKVNSSHVLFRTDRSMQSNRRQRRIGMPNKYQPRVERGNCTLGTDASNAAAEQNPCKPALPIRRCE